MDGSSNPQIRAGALEVIKYFRVSDLQALLDHARLPRQGNKRELFQRCKLLLSSNISPQLYNKINQINHTRISLTRTGFLPTPTPPRNNHTNYSSPPQQQQQHSLISSSTPTIDNLPSSNHVQYVQLPFFEKMRTIESSNIPVNSNSFPPLRFILTDFDVDLILKGSAKIFLRIAPTTITEKQCDVLPPYLFVQCNGQSVINNNIAKTVGSQAHSTTFPTDITDKIMAKSNISNTLNYLWLQLPIHMSFKNLPKSYTLSVQLVRCISLDHLVDNILKREPELTKLDSNNDSDIEIEDVGLMTTQHRVSLICPITQALIIVPVKSAYCLHLTCFDLRAFLQMNQRRLQWTCPLCKKSASYEALRVDKRLQSILANVPENCSTVEIDSSTKILSECQYILDHVKEETSDAIVSTVTTTTTTTDQNNNDREKELIQISPIKSREQSGTSDCIVLSSGSESEGEDDDDDDNNNPSNTPPSNEFFSPSTNPDQRQQATPTTNFHSVQSLITSNVDDDGDYWEDIARITYDLLAEDIPPEENQTRKRSNSSNSSLLSNNTDYPQRKRSKPTDDIEIITLLSSDSSDNDDLS